MAILKVARMGHPVLRTATQALTPEEIRSDEVQRLIDNMVDTMREYEGVGLAAPQVHESRRLCVMEVQGGGDMPVVPLTILCNIAIESFSEEKETDWEGCLSIPGIRGLVPRSKSITVNALDRHAKEVRFKATGFFARVIQHETDHLDRILFIDRMTDLSSLAFIEEMQRYSMAE